MDPTEQHSSLAETTISRRGGGDQLGVDDTVAALRALRYGALDEATRSIALPPTVRASVSPAISALRWGAVGYGLVLGAPEAFGGSYGTVMTVAICLFLTTWRTIIPVRLASTRPGDQVVAYGDIVVLGVAVGFSGGIQSPFIFTVMIAMVVVAFGWGYRAGAAALVAGSVSMWLGSLTPPVTAAGRLGDQRDLTILLTMLLAVFTAAAVRSRLLEQERRRVALAGQVEALSEANGLLSLVNSVARTLPTSLTLREALQTAQRQIGDTFEARVVCLLTLDENAEEWIPKLADGCVLQPAYRTEELPESLREALDSPDPLLRTDLGEPGPQPLTDSSGSGIYVRLETRGISVGLLGLEHPELAHFDERDVRVLAGLAEVLALTIDNARWFGRLRSLGAEEERVRLARDLHDRLGQWLTYIGFELERIITTDPAGAEELKRLFSDVQSALDELRETLRQLRSGVTEDQPLAVLGPALLDRFAERSGVEGTFLTTDPQNRLPVPVENELLRILQEALNNVARHSRASRVDVVWKLEGGNFELTVSDDGRGFEVSRGVRDSAYGLVGMRERADVIGATLHIDSSPGAGTTITVRAGIVDGKLNPRASVPMGRS